jgi:hypothetical protein
MRASEMRPHRTRANGSCLILARPDFGRVAGNFHHALPTGFIGPSLRTMAQSAGRYNNRLHSPVVHLWQERPANRKKKFPAKGFPDGPV